MLHHRVVCWPLCVKRNNVSKSKSRVNKKNSRLHGLLSLQMTSKSRIDLHQVHGSQSHMGSFPTHSHCSLTQLLLSVGGSRCCHGTSGGGAVDSFPSALTNTGAGALSVDHVSLCVSSPSQCRAGSQLNELTYVWL